MIEKNEEVIVFKCTKADKEILQRQASVERLSLSAFVRRKLFKN